MFLYHFTTFGHLEVHGTILAEGLKPSPRSSLDDNPPHGVVWLTADSDSVCRWYDNGPAECRIKIVIPSRDRRLLSYEKWIRKNWRTLPNTEYVPTVKVIEDRLDATSRTHGYDWRDWYVYFGDVTRSMIEAVEYSDPEKRAAMVGPPAMTTQ
jgi:hypothetical protein